MRKPVTRMNHNKKGKPKPKPVSVKPKPKTAQKKCKPCKPCKQQYIYHHIHHVQQSENIGAFGLADIKAGISSIKEKLVGHTEPEPEQRYFKRERNINTPLERRTKRAYVQQIPQNPPPPPPPPTQQPQESPQQPQGPKTPTLADQWRDAFNNAGGKVMQKVDQAATPQGAYNIAKAGATGAYKAGKFAVDETYKGMEWLERKRKAELAKQEKERRARAREWNALPYDKKQDILETQYLQREMRHKLRQMRQQAEDYQLDKTDAYISGRKFTPKVFKVTSDGMYGLEGETKYLDEYGREVPGIPEEVKPKRTSRSRSEAQDINNIFGFGSGSRRPIPSPLVEPAYEPRQIMGAEDTMYDQPRRRVRYASEPPQYSSQRRIEGGVSPRREADDIKRLLM